jgi:signal transduction histidine kinase
MSSTLEATLPAPAAAPTSARRSSGDVWIYLLIGALVFGAWLFTRRGYFKAGDDVGYWIGVAGAVMMLMLFSYPLRKYVRPLHRLGKVKWWFLAHMVLGIGGPLLILLHSTFRIGSLNAAVAMYSMLIVAGSGVVGRFIYLHVHRGLSGQKNNLDQLRSRAGLDESEARSRLHFAPQVEARLLAFSDHQLGARPGWATWLRQVFVLPLHMWLVYWQCAAELRRPLRKMAQRRQWSASDLSRRSYLARKLVRRYLTSVVRVAQFTAYERLFALWHVLHTPFVYILVISAVVHVIAVHAY